MKEGAVMKKRSLVGCTAFGLLAAPPLAGRTLAQTSTIPPAAGSTGDMTGTMLGAAALIALVVVIGVAVKLFDLRRRRAEETAALESRISDALMTDSALFRLPIAVSTRRGFFGRSPVIVDVHGTVPSTELREWAITLVKSEAARSGGPFSIEDRIAVDPLMVERVEESSMR
jgi:hypothetical protein